MNEMYQALESLIIALGSIPKSSSYHKKIFDLLSELENVLCREDRKAYKQWAEKFSQETDVSWEPCDAWYDELEPWIDQTEEDLKEQREEEEEDARD